MTTDYTPPPEDVEAAAKAMFDARMVGCDWCDEAKATCWDAEGDGYRSDAKATAAALHARGWRDAEEVRHLVVAIDDMETALRYGGYTYTEGAEIPWKPPVNEAAGANWRKLIEAEHERDAARAEVEAMERMRDEAEEAMGDAHLTGDTGDKRGGHVLMLPDRIRALRADRDALADRCREYKREWESAVERADSSEHLRKEAIARAEDAEQDAMFLRSTAREKIAAAEARAARLAEAQAKVSEAINQWSIAIVHLIVAAPTVELRTVLKDMADSMLKARKILAADTAEKETRE